MTRKRRAVVAAGACLLGSLLGGCGPEGAPGPGVSHIGTSISAVVDTSNLNVVADPPFEFNDWQGFIGLMGRCAAQNTPYRTVSVTCYLMIKSGATGQYVQAGSSDYNSSTTHAQAWGQQIPCVNNHWYRTFARGRVRSGSGEWSGYKDVWSTPVATGGSCG